MASLGATCTSDLIDVCKAVTHIHINVLLDRVTEGDGRLWNQNFIIWVEGDKSTDRMEDKGMAFRVYCNETWPFPPDSAPFDGIIMLTVDNVTPNPGQM